MARERFLVWLFALKLLLYPCVLLANQCPPNWKRVGKGCYRLIETKMTWEEAAEKCRELGGGLAVPDSMTEQDDFWGMVKRDFASYLHPAHFWIGCRNDQGENGDWACIEHNGIEGSFTHWTTERSSKEMKSDHCAEIKGPEGLWFVQKCNKKGYAVCETWQDVEVPTYCTITDDKGRIFSQCLTGHLIKELSIKGVIACGSACREEPRCRSFNVESHGHKKICQLNDMRRHEVGREDFVPKENCYYFERH